MLPSRVSGEEGRCRRHGKRTSLQIALFRCWTTMIVHPVSCAMLATSRYTERMS